MAVSEKKKISNAKWDAENLDRMSIALPKGSKERVKAFAESKGESVNSFVKKAIDDAINGNFGVSAEIAATLDYKAINSHIQKTGETASVFLARAVRDTIERDTSLLKMGLKVK